ncbi:MAG: tetratricopeptide repeat protein [Myxococcales bacterium]|nr:tetratricopeptide repeat protein [Myxococcota bacterium]MDW8282029.1 tetratricopeptide repeat protein [Myxococcales bacterium]
MRRTRLTVALLGTGVVAILAASCGAPVEGPVGRPAWDVYLHRATQQEPAPGDDPALFPAGPRSRRGRLRREQLDNAALCGQGGCHPDIVRQWEQSVHHLASFTNPFYRKAADYTRQRRGDAGVRWCAGCHDPVLLLSGTIDGPVTPETPGAGAGVTCLVCHGTVALQDLTGNGRYVLDVPEVGFLAPEHPLGGILRAALRLYAAPHRRGLLRPLHRQPELCSACHRVSLQPAQNGYRWLRGQDQYGGWITSGPSGRVARSFYTPAAPQRCQDCHMPLVPSQDAGNDGGLVRSHAFPGANSVVPALAGHQEQARRSAAFLQGSMRVDLFAIRKREGGAERTVAPLTQARLRPGEEVVLDVVVRNVRVGHGFPEGVLDNKEVWLEVEARDGQGRLLWREGGLDEEGRLRPTSHRYGAVLLDAAARRIDKRNINDFRVVLFRRVIGPGQSDVARYRFRVPGDAAGAIALSARLRYRKVSWDYARWTFAGRRAPGEEPPSLNAPVDQGRFVLDPQVPVPEIPVVDVATAQVTLPLDGTTPPPADHAIAPLHERLYDYGVGLLLQQDVERARRAFLRLTEEFPDFVDGHVGLARVALLIGDPDGAMAVLQHARTLAERPAGQPARARTLALLAQALVERGEYEGAQQLIQEVLRSYPRDGSLWSDLGYVHFQREEFAQAIAAYQQALAIDPDDGPAHAMLARSLRAAGRLQEAAEEEHIFDALRDNVALDGLRQQYLQRHPEEALEASMGHEHRVGAGESLP